MHKYSLCKSISDSILHDLDFFLATGVFVKVIKSICYRIKGIVIGILRALDVIIHLIY